MGVTSSNKQISAKRIECDGMLKVTLALSASPDITSNPTDIVLGLGSIRQHGRKSAFEHEGRRQDLYRYYRRSHR